MSTWTGWETEFLSAAEFPDSATNRAFLTAWAARANTNCRDNPIDLSHPVGAATKCHTLTATATAYNYQSHADAASAFAYEAFRDWALPINVLFENSEDWQTSLPSGLIPALQHWGSTRFAAWVQQQSVHVSVAPTAIHKGWNDLRQSINVRMHAARGDTNTLDAAALRALRKARRVKL